MIALVESNLQKLNALCATYDVARLDLFGSAAKGTFKAFESDLDFVVAFHAPERVGYAKRYYEFAEALESLFHRKVDLLTEAMIGDPDFRTEVDRTREIVYEQRSKQAFA